MQGKTTFEFTSQSFTLIRKEKAAPPTTFIFQYVKCPKKQERKKPFLEIINISRKKTDKKSDDQVYCGTFMRYACQNYLGYNYGNIGCGVFKRRVQN